MDRDLSCICGRYPAAESGGGFPAFVGGEELPAPAGTPMRAADRKCSGGRICIRNDFGSGSPGIWGKNAYKRHDERADGMDNIFHP